MDRSEIESFTLMQLPASTRNIQTYTETGIDRLLLLRFSADIEEVPSFILQSRFEKTLQEDYRPFVTDFGTNLSWWAIDEAKHVLGTEDQKEGRSRQILVDITNPQVAIVYVVIIEM